MDIFWKQRGGTEGSRRQLALGQGHCRLPQTVACYRNCLSPAHMHRKTPRGPGGQADLSAGSKHTHLLLPFISRARHSTRDSSTATHCKDNHSPALTGIFHPRSPPATRKRSVMLYRSYIRQNWECCRVSHSVRRISYRSRRLPGAPQLPRPHR